MIIFLHLKCNAAKEINRVEAYIYAVKDLKNILLRERRQNIEYSMLLSMKKGIYSYL